MASLYTTPIMASSSPDNSFNNIKPRPPSFMRDGSAIQLPAVRIRYKVAVVYTIIFLSIIASSIHTFREFLLNERALLTRQGRERYRKRKVSKDLILLFFIYAHSLSTYNIYYDPLAYLKIASTS